MAGEAFMRSVRSASTRASTTPRSPVTWPNARTCMRSCNSSPRAAAGALQPVVQSRRDPRRDRGDRRE